MEDLVDIMIGKMGCFQDTQLIMMDSEPWPAAILGDAISCKLKIKEESSSFNSSTKFVGQNFLSNKINNTDQTISNFQEILSLVWLK